MQEPTRVLEATLAEGRHAEALAAARRARRSGDTHFLALAESEALFGLLRYREALGVATGALRRRPADEDVLARLRLTRAQALWHTGRARPARSEAEKAAKSARLPLTRARVEETLGLFAWKDDNPGTARSHLDAARELYAACGSASGLARTLGNQGGLLKDAGRLEDALRVQSQRIEIASLTPRIDAIARARADRGATLTTLGRWTEARQELELAAELFRQVQDPRELTLAGRCRAVLELAAGDLPAARRLLARAEEAERGEEGDSHSRGETLLALSDLHLAAGELEAAERAAAQALGLFSLLGDRSGECRSRVRRVQALLTLGRTAEAVLEARRAARLAESLRPTLDAPVQLVLGRCLLRTFRAQASAAFERAQSLAEAEPGLRPAARLGQALARRDRGEARAALDALQAWGDLWLMAFALVDTRSLLGQLSAPPLVAPRAVVEVRSAASAEALVDAALCLSGEGDWPSRWAAAMGAVQPALGFWRAAVIGPAGWLLYGSESRPMPLAHDDIARAVGGDCEAPCVVDLRREPWRAHPTRVLHRLGFALITPAGPGTVLYLDRREDQPPPGESEHGLLAPLARLLARHPPEPPAEEPAPPGFPGIIGRCPAMQALFERMAKAAASEVDVHICGETGTGKEGVARALHRHSRRRQGPWVAVNASSLSDELFESEMFGHVKGAFTGAIAGRAGYVAEAEGGTLFLDEVAELSTRAQAKLLRFLQEREYRRVGEASLRRASVRVLTATNRDLGAEVAAGHFREDLLYRLDVMRLALPPLRERGDDVLRLARHFLTVVAGREGLKPPRLPADIAAALPSYPWPGNVRELENEMNRLVVLAGSGPLQKEHLSFRLSWPRPRGTLREAQQTFEREHVGRALERNGGRRVRTAEELGITRQALLGKMRRLGL